SSFGHVRDLPSSKLGVDVENNFEPTYVVPTKAKKRVKELQDLAKKSNLVYFATDEDREGEAISWHLLHLLKTPKDKAKRIAFHEITKKAILNAIEHPRELDLNLVDAQQARRILDRLVGYKLSPLLWKKVAKGLSAGRVQSVALRLIVEREAERDNFVTQEYWTVEGTAYKDENDFKINLWKKNNQTLQKFDLKEDEAKIAVKEISDSSLKVTNIEAKENVKTPPAPFTTSTLQQEANRRFGYSAKQTMMLAQQLYEGIDIGEQGSTGLITYMRTDSKNLSEDFVTSAIEYIKETLGEKYAENGGRVFKKKNKLAQEAHEAIRPTEAANAPEKIKEFLDSKQFKLYQLIWQRALASQMTDAKAENTSVEIQALETEWTLRATGSITTFAGWQIIYQNISDDEELPALEINDIIKLKTLDSVQHFTTPPARYSEAGLVKDMEKLGIGRPSTYAPTIATLVLRKYVDKIEKRLAPTEIAKVVNKLLVENFSDIVDYNFTAEMENDLDKIADGKKDWQPIIKAFYEPFMENLQNKEKEIDKKELTETATDEKCDKCGSAMVIKLGRFGKFLACSNYPECKNTKPLGEDGKPEEPETVEEKCEKCDSAMILKHGRFGKFLACSNYPECKNTKAIQKELGVICPKCNVGQMVEKKSKRGKAFFSCDQYPKCEHAVWTKPTGQLCPECKQLLLFAAKDKVKCESCEYTQDAEE
ncbi:type I DNA topoisomerase, partial [Patescibacteria group bacterium]|nr:type I DNA topoisomerase [Patescibacteria group bacterium]